MERKTRKKLLVILMIITILSTDFFILGSNLITYGTKIDSETNNPNVEFSAYFKNDAGERVDSIEESIKNENLRLYAEVQVKNEGYFNGAIEIQDSNFNIKNEILSSNTYISSIEGNKVNLKQINAGDVAEIELGIEPIIADKMSADMLTKISIVKLNGSYTGSTDSGIQYGREVSITFHEDESAVAELETDIITNKVFAVNGENKRIVQLLIKSRLIENQYPVEQTTLRVTVPQLSGEQPEEINVLAIGKLATNGLTEISEQDWVNENGILQININNTPDSNNEITWDKNICDKLVVTYIYDENVNTKLLNITTNSELKVHNSDKKYKAESTENENQELNNIIMTEPQITTEEIYKGQLYANINATEKKDIQYNTVTTLIVTNADVVDEIVIHEGPDSFGTSDSELAANTKYIKTEINKEKMLEILGTDGNIEIKNGDKTTLINKDAEVDGNGNVVIDYENIGEELDITTSKPVAAGILEIKHTKAITENDYTRNQLKTVNTLKTTNSILGTITVDKEKQNIVEQSAEASIELKETVSKAELTINRQSLATTTVNDVTLGITLVTDDVKYDLYKNPVIRLEMPEVVNNVVVNNVKKLYDDDLQFGQPSVSVTEENNIKIIQIALSGEQKTYPTEQLYIKLDVNIELAELAGTQMAGITMKYKNDNASKYENETTNFGVVQKEIEISGPGELVTMFNLGSNENTSTTEKIAQQVVSKDAGKEMYFEIAVVNDTDADMNNAKILGKLPTTGNIITGQNFENTLETKVKNINAPNATVYYTSNVNATADINDLTNGWSTDSTNAKLYLIDLGTLNKASNYEATINVVLPSVIPASAASYTEYEIIYDTGSKTSRQIGLITSLVAMLETTLTAQVGQETLSDNSPVKEGEVIKYTATVENNGTQTLEGVQLKVGVPEGTVVVEPVENYVDASYTYYEEKTNIEEILVDDINLIPGQTYTTEYEVRVNKGQLAEGTQLSNKAIVTYDNSSMESNVITNILQESNVRVTIKKLISDDVQIYAGSSIEYMIYVENLSDETITDLQMQIISDALTLTSVTNSNTYLYDDSIPEKISIEEIPANGLINFRVTADVDEEATQIDTSVTVADSNTEYRSNMLTQILPYTDASITVTANPQNNEIVEYNDQIKYSIIAKNTGTVSGNITIEDTISDYLKVEAIYINGELKYQSTDETAEKYVQYISNSISEFKNLEPQEEIQLEILARVIYNPSEGQGIKNVKNYATVSFASVKKDSAEVTHMLQATSISEEELGNIISGSIWLDKDANGQKDSGDIALPGIYVKLYDESTGTYLTDDNSEIIQAITDADGEYIVTKVPDGSYKIVIEYDMDKYEPTTDSRVKLENISIGEEIVTVTITESIKVNDNISEIDIGLKEKSINIEESKKTISGFVWLDSNKDGQKDDTEKLLSGIIVKLYSNGNIIKETLTNSKGQYYFSNIEKGSYIIIFEYDTEKYEPTTYLAEGVNVTQNSKADINKIHINGQEMTVTSTDTIDIQDNVTDINLGLKDKNIDSTIENDENNKDDDNTDDEENENNQDKNDKENQKVISGYAWLDANRNGQKDAGESLLQGIKVRLYDSSNKSYLKDSNGNIIEATTDVNGKYAFNNIEKGLYIVLFQYDIEKYEPTTYLTEGVDTTRNSKVILKKVEIDGQEVTLGVTDVIKVEDNVFNINIGLKEILKFDLELNKYISKIVLQNNKETKTYNYENSKFEKIEIHRKRVQGSLVVLEYTIKVKNNGEVAGYAKNIVDYVPKGLTFSSELNKDWYLSGDYLYTKSLENVEINPGEEKEIKLILTKTMTNENVGLINNRAEIYNDYNKFGESDIDSTPNNQVQSEDDFDSVDVIIGISTGGSIFAYIILLMINIILIGVAIKIMIQNNIIKISFKRKRG